MQIENVRIDLHRTMRVPSGKTPAQLPPSLGILKTYRVADYREKCPELWEDGGVFVPLHDAEAMWISFHLSGSNPRALIIGAGNVNAITGKKLTTILEIPQNYVVVPTQPWLDGWKDETGVVYQFVSAKYEGGTGLTVGEQILGQDSNTGGIGIAVYNPTDPNLSGAQTFSHYPVAGLYDGSEWQGAGALGDLPVTRGCATKGFGEMGLGKGGAIAQKVYPDPFTNGRNPQAVWESSPVATMAIYLVNAASFAEITGETVQPSPVTSDSYGGPYFQVDDDNQPDAPGSSAFVGLKSAF